MRPFKYSNASETAAAINAVVVNPTARFLGGGTNLVDLMKEDVMRPSELVNVTRLKFSAVEKKKTDYLSAERQLMQLPLTMSWSAKIILYFQWRYWQEPVPRSEYGDQCG